ncbi:MAG: hypothetical protein NZ789_19020, partial [Pseudomonadales bacterium]|nr:hypothetical protein [Pseudomonadales bacterium]
MVPHTTAWQRGAAAAGATPYNPQVGQQLINNSYHEMMMAHTTGQALFPGESLPGAPGGMTSTHAQYQTVPITQQQLCSAQPDYVYPTTRQAWVSSATPTTIGGRPPFVPAIDMQPVAQQLYHAVPVQVRKSSYLGIQDIAHMNLERMAKDLEKEERERWRFNNQVAKEARENERRRQHNFGGSDYDDDQYDGTRSQHD